mmetsp:Transcript_18669/g.56428  ORF Transcript_18669/g.56428 Transcript_18669/m.56428 type:complete len:248 (-) Transcript_18669:199-942(-)|eukprot:CAMPEP_0206139790 /NCGR_PEP_ID=MMETSP1473-20131121/7271_1 /ASSEMBLY_ACC=CAM_ASM_001109 /TAXON_ID=1461547 /ORGANISM="Stichococcus sp, Strain RCC1054" /LENGTH=247 /DNA_ID=CAMNT_0053533697 /DNA_START=212 /DNA_END=955 /DNA_ORIENTATION=+
MFQHAEASEMGVKGRIEEAKRRKAQRTAMTRLLIAGSVVAVLIVAAKEWSSPGTALRVMGQGGPRYDVPSAPHVGSGGILGGGDPKYWGGLADDGVVYYWSADGKGRLVQVPILEEEHPEECHAEDAADYGGNSLVWGLEFKTKSAADCCRFCRDFKGNDGRLCNTWVWCGSPTGICWSADKWNHTTGSCWLKAQDGWDEKVGEQRAESNLLVNYRGLYKEDFRAEHPEAPEKVAFTSGNYVHERAT